MDQPVFINNASHSLGRNCKDKIKHDGKLYMVGSIKPV
ncbi:hypothetical protein J2X69_000659 [Algoriphagus sp. 4150]|nr:hypothetical protein [Algoriphagus sp. 4150]